MDVAKQQPRSYDLKFQTVGGMMAVVSKMRATTRRISQQGFTMLQMIIVVALIGVVTTFSTIGIVNARARIRLARSARQFTTLAEKTRADSVRRHGTGGAMSNLRVLSTTSYSVTMDFDNNGVVDGYDTQTFNLEEGIAFASGWVGSTITFDWRGRSVGGQVELTMLLAPGTANAATTLITISGSGDITLDSESFPDDSIPEVALSGTPDPNSDIRPDPPPNPTPGSGLASPTPTPSGTPDPNATPTPYPTSTPLPTPTPCNNHGVNCRADTPTPTPTPQPTPVASPSATPTPSAGACTLTPSVTSLTLGNRGAASLTLNVQNSSGPTTVTLSGNTNTSHISVGYTPGQTGVVSGSSGTVSFNVLMNGNNQEGTITFTASSPCSASASVGINR